MNDLGEFFSYSFNQRALLAAAVIGFANGFMSGFVVLRRSALFAGALANTLFPGITIGFLLAGVSMASAFLGALGAALFVGLAAVGLGTRTRIDRDSALAVLWTTVFACGLLLHDRMNLHVEIQDYLFGNILGLSNTDLITICGVGAIVLGTLVLLQRPLIVMMFEADVAASQGVPVRRFNALLMGLLVLAMICSVQAVGVILALGLLVAPGAAMVLCVDNPRSVFWGGGVLGALLAMAAVVLSNLFDLRTGATIVILLGGVFLLVAIFSPRYGLLAARFSKARTDT